MIEKYERVKFGYRLRRFYTSKTYLGKEEGKMIARISIFGVLAFFLSAIVSIVLDAGWLFFIFAAPIVIIVFSTRLVSWVRWFGTRGRHNWRYWSGEYYELAEEDEES